MQRRCVNGPQKPKRSRNFISNSTNGPNSRRLSVENEQGLNFNGFFLLQALQVSNSTVTRLYSRVVKHEVSLIQLFLLFSSTIVQISVCHFVEQVTDVIVFCFCRVVAMLRKDGIWRKRLSFPWKSVILHVTPICLLNLYSWIAHSWIALMVHVLISFISLGFRWQVEVEEGGCSGVWNRQFYDSSSFTDCVKLASGKRLFLIPFIWYNCFPRIWKCEIQLVAFKKCDSKTNCECKLIGYEVLAKPCSLKTVWEWKLVDT